MLKKYSIAALFSLLLVFTVFTGGGFAQASEPAMSPEIAEALAEVETANAEIYAEIAKVQEKAERMYAGYLAQIAKTTDSQKQAKALAKYNVKIEAEIAKLQEKAEGITFKGLEKAKAAGLDVDIELVNIRFADREALVDPIVVIGW